MAHQVQRQGVMLAGSLAFGVRVPLGPCAAQDALADRTRLAGRGASLHPHVVCGGRWEQEISGRGAGVRCRASSSPPLDSGGAGQPAAEDYFAWAAAQGIKAPKLRLVRQQDV